MDSLFSIEDVEMHEFSIFYMHHINSEVLLMRLPYHGILTLVIFYICI